MLAIGATLAANGRPNAAERLEGAPALIEEPGVARDEGERRRAGARVS